MWGRDGPRESWGHWEGPEQGWEIVPECYQPIVWTVAGLSPLAGQGRAIKGCVPPALDAGDIRGGIPSEQHAATALPWDLPSPLPPRPASCCGLR